MSNAAIKTSGKPFDSSFNVGSDAILQSKHQVKTGGPSFEYCKQFDKAFLQLIEGQRTGCMADFAYANGGLAEYDKVTKLPEFYITKDELAVLNSAAEEVAKTLKGQTITYVSRAPGRSFGAKDKILINALNKANVDVAKVLYIDTSLEALNLSARQGRQLLPNAAHEKVCSDIYAEETIPIVQNKMVGKGLFVSLGGTDMNTSGRHDGMPPKAPVKKRFERARALMRKGDYAVTTFDHEHDKTKIKQAYGRVGDFCKHMLKYRFQKDVSHVEYVNEFGINSHVLGHGYRFHEDDRFTLYPDDEPVVLEIGKGLTVWFLNSAKFPQDMTRELIEETGQKYHDNKVIRVPENPIGLHYTKAI